MKGAVQEDTQTCKTRNVTHGSDSLLAADQILGPPTGVDGGIDQLGAGISFGQRHAGVAVAASAGKLWGWCFARFGPVAALMDRSPAGEAQDRNPEEVRQTGQSI
jgi:hypothetical protein